MSVLVVDASLEILETGKKILPKLERILIKEQLPPIEINLINWENAGLRIGIKMEGFGEGHYNEKPYLDREIASREFNYVLREVQNGNYQIKLLGHNKIELVLNNKK